MSEEIGMYIESSRKMGFFSAGGWDSGGCEEEGVEWRKEILLFTSFPSILSYLP